MVKYNKLNAIEILLAKSLPTITTLTGNKRSTRSSQRSYSMTRVNLEKEEKEKKYFINYYNDNYILNFSIFNNHILLKKKLKSFEMNE